MLVYCIRHYCIEFFKITILEHLETMKISTYECQGYTRNVNFSVDPMNKNYQGHANKINAIN